SVFGENRPMDVDGGTPISPEQVSSPVIATGVRPTVMSPLASTFPITSNIISSPVQDKFSPLDEPKVTPTVGMIRSRPSFDLSSLWSGGPDGEMRIPTRTDDTVPLPPDEENEAEMDLDDDQPGDQDFGMFLDGVEEPSRPSAATTKPTTPPVPTQEDSNIQSLPVIWSGELIMPLDPNPALINDVSVKQVGGRPLGVQPSVWSQLFTKPKTLIEGRVPTDRATKYLVTTRLNATKELIVVLFEPKDSRTKFTDLLDFLVKK
ncbi:15032_t:CDS:2, partial [Acaulospora colombiana]